jgi:hypothetical protein
MKEHFKVHGTIHLFWTIGILTAIIIALLSGKFAANDNVKDMLSFAVALASLLLALIAIIQALLTSSTLGDTFSSINRALNNIREPASEIIEAAKLLNARSENIETQAVEIGRRLAETLSEQDAPPIPPMHTEGPFPEGLLTSMPAGGRLALYVAAKANEKNRSFKVRDIFSDSRMAFFVVGFLMALDVYSILPGAREKIQNLGRMPWLSKHFSKLKASASVKMQGYYTEVDTYFDQQISTQS